MITDIFVTFKTMNSQEYNLFKKFIKYRCNKKKSSLLLKLFAYFYARNDKFKIDENISAKLKHETNLLTDTQLSNLVKEAKQVLYDFLAHQQLDTQILEKEKLITSALAARNYNTFEKRVKDITEKSEDKVALGREISPSDYLLINELNEKLFFHPDTEKLKPEVESLNEMLININKFYALKKLRILCDLLIREKHLSGQANVEFDWMLALIKPFPEPVFQLYAHLLPLLKNHNHELFTMIFSEFKAKVDYLDSFDKGAFLEKLKYHANRIYEMGEIEYLPPLFELFDMADKYDVIVQNNKINYLTFINAVSIAASAKNFVWADYFINKHKQFLSNDMRVETEKVAQAYVYFFKEQFDASLQEISPIKKWKHLGTRLSSETLQLRIYYERIFRDKKDTDLEAFGQKAANLKRFLQKDREKKLSVSKKEAIRNFITFLNNFIDYSYNPNNGSEDYYKLQEKLHKTSPVIAKAWLNSKFMQLRKPKGRAATQSF